PAGRAIDQIEATRNRGAVAVDSDNAGSRDIEQHPAVAAGAEGGVDINAAGMGRELRDRFAAENRDVAGGITIGIAGGSHAPAPPAKRVLPGRCDASGSIAPQMPVSRETFALERPQPGGFADSPRPDSRRPCPKTLV